MAGIDEMLLEVVLDSARNIQKDRYMLENIKNHLIADGFNEAKITYVFDELMTGSNILNLTEDQIEALNRDDKSE